MQITPCEKHASLYSATMKVLQLSCILLLLLMGHGLQADNFVKADNTATLNLGSSWTNGSVPGTNDTIVITNIFTSNRTANLGTNLSVLGVVQSDNANRQFTFGNTAGSVLTLGSGGVVKGSTNFALTFDSAVSLGASQTWAINGGNLQLNGAFNDNGHTLLVTGPGIFDLRGSNTFGTNVTISSSGVNVSGGITVTLQNAGNTFTNLQIISGRVRAASIGNFNTSSAAGSGGSNSAITLGGATTSGVFEYTGSSTATDRTFAMDHRVSTNSGIEVSTAGQTLTLNGAMLLDQTGATNAVNNSWNLGGAGNLVVNTVLSNTTNVNHTTGVNKIGTGTLTLAATNTYIGHTSVKAGTLVVNGSLHSNSVVTVATNATLGGTGVVNGETTINGMVAPGNSIGTLTVSNNVTWNSSTNNAWKFELGTAGISLANPGTSDLLVITGDFIKGTGSTFYFDFQDSGAHGWYKLVDWDGTTSFTDLDFLALNLTDGLSGNFVVDAGTSALYIQVVPEPSTYALLALGAAGLSALFLRRLR